MTIGFKDPEDDLSYDHYCQRCIQESSSGTQETRRAAQILFTDFYQQEFLHEGVTLEESQANQQQQRDYDEFSRQILTTVGQDLRRIAEQIEGSEERAIIRRKAEQISFRVESYDLFSTMLKELFPNGRISREGIVVLFFFCSDFAFKAYSSGPFTYFNQIIGWSLRFIFHNICSWVQNKGGWEKVLREYIPSTAVTVCSILGSVALAIYIRNNI